MANNTEFFSVLLIVYLSTVTAQVNFKFDKSCYNEGDEVVFTATYTGTGTEVYVNWIYAKKVGGNYVIEISDCTVFTGDPGYPTMIPGCNSASKTYTATISAVASSALGEEWGASFKLSDGTTTPSSKKTLLKCENKPEEEGVLSEGEKAGIGVGVSVAGILLIAAIVAFVIYKKKQKENKT